jgi:hypothetical protein
MHTPASKISEADESAGDAVLPSWKIVVKHCAQSSWLWDNDCDVALVAVPLPEAILRSGIPHALHITLSVEAERFW